jgi:hypothetical protein
MRTSVPRAGLSTFLLTLATVACSTIPAQIVDVASLETALVGCAGVGLDAVLVGNASDPAHAWLQRGAERIDVTWPPGTRARFAPSLEILASDGGVIAREGDHVAGACVLPSGGLYVEPPF